MNPTWTPPTPPAPKRHPSPPQWHINEQVHKRGWTLEDFAKHSGLNEYACCSLMQGWTMIGFREALGLEKAFGISAETWLFWEMRWQLTKVDEAREPKPSQSTDEELITIDLEGK